MDKKREYIKVNELITDRKSSENANTITYKILNSEHDVIVIDWDDSGVLGAPFMNTYLDNLRSIHFSKKVLINLNMSKSNLNAFKSFMVDPKEEKIFKHFENLRE